MKNWETLFNNWGREFRLSVSHSPKRRESLVALRKKSTIHTHVPHRLSLHPSHHISLPITDSTAFSLVAHTKISRRLLWGVVKRIMGKTESGHRAPGRRMLRRGWQIAASTSVDHSEAESDVSRTTSTRVRRTQKTSTDIQHEIKVEKEVKVTSSGRRMFPV